MDRHISFIFQSIRCSDFNSFDNSLFLWSANTICNHRNRSSPPINWNAVTHMNHVYKSSSERGMALGFILRMISSNLRGIVNLFGRRTSDWETSARRGGGGNRRTPFE